MTLVLDTNVLVAAFAARGLAHEVVGLCLVEHEVLIDSNLLNELSAVLLGKIRLPEPRVAAIDGLLRDACRFLVAEPLPGPVCRDPDDDRIIALAVSGGAECLVTGDQDLLVLQEYRGIPFLDCRTFWERLRAERP